jgi:hypothetical protein
METSGFFCGCTRWVVFSLLDKKDGYLIGSSLLFVSQMLTEKIALMWDVTSCSLVEKY